MEMCVLGGFVTIMEMACVLKMLTAHSYQDIANYLKQRMAYVPITGEEHFAHTAQMETHSHMQVSSVLMIAGAVLDTKLYWYFSYFCTGLS